MCGGGYLDVFSHGFSSGSEGGSHGGDLCCVLYALLSQPGIDIRSLYSNPHHFTPLIGNLPVPTLPPPSPLFLLSQRRMYDMRLF